MHYAWMHECMISCKEEYWWIVENLSIAKYFHNFSNIFKKNKEAKPERNAEKDFKSSICLMSSQDYIFLSSESWKSESMSLWWDFHDNRKTILFVGIFLFEFCILLNFFYLQFFMVFQFFFTKFQEKKENELILHIFVLSLVT